MTSRSKWFRYSRDKACKTGRTGITAFILMCVLACSGGNTSSGGIRSSDFAGSYSGTFSFTAASIEVPAATTTSTGSASAQVNQENRIILRLSNGVELLALISTIGEFGITVAANEAINDVDCSQGTVSFAGQFGENSQITANVSSQNLVCDGLTAQLTGTVDLARD